MSCRIDFRPGFQQLSHDVIVPHLSRNPQGSGTVRPPCIRLRSLRQQEQQYFEVSVLGRYEQGRRPILHMHVHFGAPLHQLLDDVDVSALARHE